jgi:hypothetical protein
MLFYNAVGARVEVLTRLYMSSDCLLDTQFTSAERGLCFLAESHGIRSLSAGAL